MFQLSTGIIKHLRLAKHRKITYNIYRSSATNTQNKTSEKSKGLEENPTALNEQNVDDFTTGGIKISTRVQTKLPPRPPILKNMFLGKVDKTLIPYPEVIPRDDMEKLQDELKILRSYFNDILDTKKIESTQCIPQETHDELKQLGVYGLNVPQHLGGKGLFVSESYIAMEAETNSPDITTVLNSHRIVVDMILKYCSDEQKSLLLPKLADGSCIATDALQEEKIKENMFFNTVAEFDSIDNEWLLNGEKTSVINANNADLLLVLAETRHLNKSGDMEAAVSAFLVDSSLPGVKKEIQFPLGCRGSGISRIVFEKVRLPTKSLIGKIGENSDLIQYLLNSHRLKTTSKCIGWLKNLIKHITEYSITTKQNGVSLMEFDNTKDKLSRLVMDAYVSESMLYYLCGIIDEFENQDVGVECAAAKLFALESLWKGVTSTLEFLGPNALLNGNPLESTLRNSAQLCTYGESLDSLRLYIGLSGIQHTGKAIYNDVEKQRNPLFHPGYILKKLINTQNIENPKSNLELNFELHPSLEPASICLEKSIVRLELSTATLLTRYGNEIIEKHVEVKRLSEMATIIFAMLASISRASRSYCIGLAYADYETLLASTMALTGHNRIKDLATEVALGPIACGDKNFKRISKQILKSKGYFPVHPLTYNF